MTGAEWTSREWEKMRPEGKKLLCHRRILFCDRKSLGKSEHTSDMS